MSFFMDAVALLLVIFMFVYRCMCRILVPLYCVLHVFATVGVGSCYFMLLSTTTSLRSHLYFYLSLLFVLPLCRRRHIRAGRIRYN